MRNLHREPPEHQESTQRHQIRSCTSIAQNKSYIEKRQNRRNLHSEIPNQKESTQNHQNARNLHRATRRNLHRDAPEQKEPTQSHQKKPTQRCTRTEGMYSVRPQIRKNLHRETVG